MSDIHQHTFDSGLVLVAEPIAHAQSLAMTMLLPGGVVAEQADRLGAATLVSEMICRGAGELDARAHSDALDQLGVQRGTEVQTHHLRIGATMLGDKLADALPLLFDMALRPMLAEAALGPSRDLALQSLDALEDEPQQKVFLELKSRHLPPPFGRSPLGERDSLEAMSLDDIRNYWKSCFVPGSAILGFAGKLDWQQLMDQVGQRVDGWLGRTDEPAATGEAARSYINVAADTSQVHIGLMYDALPESDERSVLCRAATAVLSGGMSGRLFTEVREKRGLCYAVYAAYAGHRDRGAVISYAGTTVPRAQETLDVLRGEHIRLSEGIEDGEFERAIVGMKSRLVMQGESTSARARAIAADQYVYGRPRTLDESAAEVEAVTADQLRAFVKDHPPGPMTIVTIGPDALAVE